MLKAYLKIAFDELRCFNSSLYIEADVHFHLGFMVCKLDDWHLRTGQRLNWNQSKKGRSTNQYFMIHNELIDTSFVESLVRT